MYVKFHALTAITTEDCDDMGRDNMCASREVYGYKYFAPRRSFVWFDSSVFLILFTHYFRTILWVWENLLWTDIYYHSNNVIISNLITSGMYVSVPCSQKTECNKRSAYYFDFRVCEHKFLEYNKFVLNFGVKYEHWLGKFLV